MRFYCFFVSICLSSIASAQIYRVQTFAGGGLPQNIQASTANIGHPSAVAADGSGNVFIALTDYSIVVKVDSAGVLTLVAGNGVAGFGGDGGPASNAEISMPSGIAVDAGGDLYIADQGNLRIRKVSNGVITTIAGTGLGVPAGDGGAATNAIFGALHAIAVDAAGNVYITDGNTIREISNGIISTIAGTGTTGFSGDNGPAKSAQFNAPWGMAVDNQGVVYVADQGNERIRKISAGVVTTIAGNGTLSLTGDNGPAINAGVEQPSGVALDSSGSLYVSEQLGRRIRKISGGVITTIAGFGGSGYNGDNIPATSALLGDPSGLTADSSGNIYVADTRNLRVRRISGGVITTTAGGGTVPKPGVDGPATSVSLSSPFSVAVGPDGSVYFGDFGVGVRRVKNGVVTTVAVTVPPSAPCGTPSPYGLAVTANGDIYMAEANPGCIRKISNGTITLLAGGTLTGSGCNFSGPATSAGVGYGYGIAVDSSGNVYFADTNNSCIRKIANGTITTVAGTGTTGTSGDGVPATGAQISAPQSLALDSAGNVYFSDGGARIRKVANGIISTVFDGGFGISAIAFDHSDNLYVAQSNGEIFRVSNGSRTMIAQVGAPWGMAVDNAGDIYFSDLAPGSAGNSGTGPKVIRALMPSDSVCVQSVNPPIVNANLFGGSYSLAVAAQDSQCSWTVANLPDWITLTGQGSGSGNANVTLSVAISIGAPRSATISIGGLPVTVNQADGTCVYSLPASGRSFPASAGASQFSITSHLGCPAPTASSNDAWISVVTPTSSLLGSYGYSYQVAANSGGDRTGTITVGGQTYTVEQQAASIPGLAIAGSLAQVNSQGGWSFELDAVNLGTSAATARVNFTASNGSPLFMPLSFPQLATPTGPEVAATLDRTINPNARLVIDSSGSASASALLGSGQILSTGNVSGFGIFSFPAFNWTAVVPLETRKATTYSLPFDNTGALTTGVALSNITTSPVSVKVTILSDAGVQIGTDTLPFGSQAFQQFLLPSKYPQTAAARGTIQFQTTTPGQISVLGVRANGIAALTTLPVLSNLDLPGGSISDLTYGGGFVSTFYLVNTGTSSAAFTLSFYDQNGSPVSVPLAFPQTTATQTTTNVTQTLAAGQMLEIATQASAAASPNVAGSAQLTTADGISGFEIFDYIPNGQEASVPLETRTPNNFVLVYDNTNGLTTGVALANTSTTQANIAATIYDDQGDVLQNTSIPLAAHAQQTIVLNTAYPNTANKRGMVQFVKPPSGAISMIGIRVGTVGATTTTTIPILAR